MKKVYVYDDKGFYAGEGFAQESPREPGKLLMPANSTEEVPPKANDKEVVMFKDGAWKAVPDYRNTVYYFRNANGDVEVAEIKEVGVKVPDGAFLKRADVPKTTEEKAAELRAKRDGLLAQTDYLLMADYPITAEQLEEVKVYRQALRDITMNKNFPDVELPAKPAFLGE